MLDVTKEGFFDRQIKTAKHRRYTLSELLHGVSKEEINKHNKETEWMREGRPVGREII